MMLRLIACLLFCFGVQASFAQVYSWKDPATGSTQVSNRAPAWYLAKEEVRGPRVLVTWYDRLIDDTALPLEARLAMNPAARPGPKGAGGPSAGARAVR